MSLKERKILIIDADSEQRAILRRFLGELGPYEAIEASRIQEGLEIFNNTEDILGIICEWDLPGASGYTLLKFIRSQKRYEDLFFVMMTDVTSDRPEQKIIHSSRFHIDGFLLKPIKLDALGATLKRRFPEKPQDVGQDG